MLLCVKQNIVNDIILALSFMVLFTAYNTQTHIQKTLTVSIQNDNPSYYADGYICFGIIYSLLAITMWMSPSFILLFGIKVSLIVGALCYMSFVSLCYFEISWLTYMGCAITGFGAALLWTAQATYLTLNSETGKIYRSIRTFWVIYQLSYLIGNLLIYYQFNDSKQVISHTLRGQIAIVLMAIVLISVMMLFGVRRPLRENDVTEKNTESALNELKKVFRICTSTNIIKCFIPFSYCGINLTYMSVIAASTGFAKYLSPNSKSLAPLSGVFQGIGEIVGCSLSLGLNNKAFLKLGLIPTACLVNAIAYTISFFGLPKNSNYGYTNELPLTELSICYMLLANVFLGIGDACIHIELYNFIGTLFPNDSAPAFAIFKFVRCLGAAVSFYYSSFLSLYSQLLILIILSLLTSFVYCHSMRLTNSPPTITQKLQKCQQSNYATAEQNCRTNA